MIKTITLSLVSVLVLIIAAAAHADDVNVKALHKSKWVQLETKNFLIVTDAKVKQAQQMAEELERFSYFLSFLLGYTQNTLPYKVPVVLARSKKSFHSMGIPKGYAGLFAYDNAGNAVIFANAKGFSSASSGSGNWGRSVVLHELVHLLMKNSTFDVALPPWYNEGIAEYFGTYIEKSDHILLGDVSIMKARFRDMVDNFGRPISIDSESLLKTEQTRLLSGDSSFGAQQQFVNRFYARSFGVVHYLNSIPEMRAQMFTYLHLINKGYSVEETFAHVFKMSFTEFDKLVNDYLNSRFVMGRTFPTNVEGGVTFPEFPFSSRPMEQRRALEYLVSKINFLPPSILAPDAKDAMLTDARAIYPGFSVMSR